ncbi:DUF4097 family beta strand repeat-containing protein [Micropruina sonneratiae]|uniref:DUF4097 family beta strand repeat-containing protein n=1 Tax=Micropruina sonneratiae TaxID=2986940 RepID=UPI002225B882|nr:DUF4097 domain-containing protein [Micropruina sp. KQZ13P-5]MCW3158491.1 DUF4097 domain-containing protein [Micropruina sp. KQZ13P-5]
MNTTTSTSQTWEFAVDELPRLFLQAHQGDIHLRHSGGPGQVEVTVSTDVAVDFQGVETRTDGRDVRVVIPALLNPEGRGFALQLGSLSIGAGNTVRSRIDVLVPPDADLELQVGGGNVTVEGRSGTLRVRTGGGDVRFDEAGTVQVRTGGGDVSAVRAVEGRLDTGGGDIRLKSLGEGSISTGGGDVSVRTFGPGRISTGGGDIRVQSTEGDVTLHTGGGDVNLDGCRGRSEVTTGAGDVRIGVLAGQLNVRTGAGDISITVPPEVPVWQDLSSPLGEVVSRIAGRGEPVEGQEHVEVVARTGTGDITLA